MLLMLLGIVTTKSLFESMYKADSSSINFDRSIFITISPEHSGSAIAFSCSTGFQSDGGLDDALHQTIPPAIHFFRHCSYVNPSLSSVYPNSNPHEGQIS